LYIFIRNLHHSTNPNDISDELERVGHKARNIINVQIKRKVDSKTSFVKLPLFRVELEPRDNNKDVLEVTHILYCKIKIELPRRSNELPQCKRCQSYGHSKNYCTKTPRCVKCGEKHLSKDCKKPLSDKPKCANCGNEHTASYKGCALFQRLTQPVHGNKPTAVDRIRENPNSKVAPPVLCKDRTFASAVRSTPDFSTPARSSSLVPTRAALPTSNSAQIGSSTTKNASEISQILSMIKEIANAQKAMQENLTDAVKRIEKLEGASKSPPSPVRKVRKK
jgi:hypothetical protein